MDDVIQAKADEITARAFKIYVAVKGLSKKEVLADALAGRTHIPQEYFDMARKEIENEKRAAE